MTWNHVLADLFKFKKAKWWQPFLVLGTIVVLCAPCRKAGKMHGRHHCKSGHCMHQDAPSLPEGGEAGVIPPPPHGKPAKK